MSDEPKKRWRRSRWSIALVAVLTLYVLSGIGLNTYRFFDSRAISSDVNRARSAALESTGTTMTPDDARRWLESNGYQVVIWNPHESQGFIGTRHSSIDGNHLSVLGQRQVRRGGWPLRPTWIDLEFRFTSHGTFEDVQADSSLVKIP